jgi:hypothetical protein
MATTPEGRVKKKVTDMLKKHKVWYYMPVSGGFGSHGIPDFVGCVRGRFIGIECKADANKKLTPLQMAVRNEIENAFGLYFVVYDDASLTVAEQSIILLQRV